MTERGVGLSFSSVVYFLLGAFAFYLSWTCTENLVKFGEFGDSPFGTLIRIIYAVMAFLFWPLYLILYFFFFMGGCSSGYKKSGYKRIQKPRRFSTRKINS
jgi:hypothetical protein